MCPRLILFVTGLCVGLHTAGRNVYVGRIGAVPWRASLSIRKKGQTDGKVDTRPMLYRISPDAVCALKSYHTLHVYHVSREYMLASR